MTVDLWPCHQCGNPGVRNIGTQGFCAVHLAALYATFDPAVFRMAGIGLPDGPTRPDWGPLYADLACVACGATWTGVPGEPCRWCQHAHEVMLDHQADLALTPPDTNPDDTHRAEALAAWADRLEVAVTAGTVTYDQAARALRQAAA